MPTPAGHASDTPTDKESLSPGSFPTVITTTRQAPARRRVTERISGFWVNGVDLSKIEDKPARGGECDTEKFLVARPAAQRSSTVHVSRDPFHVSWTQHSLFHPPASRPTGPEPIGFPQYVLDTILGQIVYCLQLIFPGKNISVAYFIPFIITEVRLRRQEVSQKFKDMRDCKACYAGSNTSTAEIYECLLSRELTEDLLVTDDKLIQVLRETVVILEDASHPDNPLAPYPVSSPKGSGVETFVLAAFLIAMGEYEGHTENHARLIIEILSAALPKGHRYTEYMNLDFLDRAMAELHGYRRSYVKFPQ